MQPNPAGKLRRSKVKGGRLSRKSRSCRVRSWRAPGTAGQRDPETVTTQDADAPPRPGPRPPLPPGLEPGGDWAPRRVGPDPWPVRVLGAPLRPARPAPTLPLHPSSSTWAQMSKFHPIPDPAGVFLTRTHSAVPITSGTAMIMREMAGVGDPCARLHPGKQHIGTNDQAKAGAEPSTTGTTPSWVLHGR